MADFHIGTSAKVAKRVQEALKAESPNIGKVVLDRSRYFVRTNGHPDDAMRAQIDSIITKAWKAAR